MNREVPKWEQWFLKHRSDEVALVVVHLMRKLLSKGSVTAEDAHSIEVKNPSVRGAAMRALRDLKVAVQDGFTRGTTAASHGHVMGIWRLTDASRAETILANVCRIVAPASGAVPQEKNGQMLLC